MLLAMRHTAATEGEKGLRVSGPAAAPADARRYPYTKMLMGVGLSLLFMVLTWP